MMIRNRCLLVGSLLVLLAGCAHRSVERTVSADAVGESGQTRQVNYLHSPLGPGSPDEETPGGVQRSAVADEAELSALTEREVCIRYVARTYIDLDEPLSFYEVKLNGHPVAFDNEVVSVVDHFYSGRESVFAAEGVVAETFSAINVTRPAEKSYRVIERRAEVCGPRSTTGRELLELKIPEGPLDDTWGQKFAWTVR
ncbi:hypothetical protein FRC98_18420 [Lujinxingia vulgaris]|uniref:Lipoprotein n=1 Tax=Lujinxingia vulgaris TaxID=2600176 RepID=A0A5C6X492_9DELT|nr:hypothetical protein [Lujinxingia vulgaris]TXD34389.1 hypothetical protein FRC98_18420 [Lujinxingia vulgaris]